VGVMEDGELSFLILSTVFFGCPPMHGSLTPILHLGVMHITYQQLLRAFWQFHSV
jgi:hypothetical protein